MIRSLLFACTFVAAAVGTACSGGGDNGSGAGVDRERDLRETVETVFKAFQDGDIVAFYGYFTDDFQNRCSEKDFREIMVLARVFITGLDNVDLEVGSISFEDDDHATANIFITGDGGEAFAPTEDDDGFFDTWVREDGDWKTDIDDPKPCDLSFDTGGGNSDSDDETPVATGPGTSRDEAVAIGDTVASGDYEATVLGVDLDAADDVLALNEFNDPPRSGQRFVLATVRVRHAGTGSETISVSSSDFKLTGSANVLYDSFGDASCGFIEGEIAGEMFPGGEIEGTVCFQVPQDETSLILVAQPFFSFDDGDRRFLALE